eukprot:scaffold89037_cov40-Attheya_sp.AAC.2
MLQEAGMNQPQIKSVLSGFGVESEDILFEGFPEDPLDGWYCHGTGFETRLESETRASKFYLWLCEFLDQQLKLGNEQEDPTCDNNNDDDDDVFDAGVSVPGEEHEEEHDKFSTRHRRRRTTILVGHGDFMALVLKRIISGFGHYVGKFIIEKGGQANTPAYTFSEHQFLTTWIIITLFHYLPCNKPETEGVSHRSAFVHFNTGITELEYFGHGRFLLMSSNQMPHLSGPGDLALRSGGSLKDGWAYLVPEVMHLDDEVTVAFSDEVNDHVKEQTVALKSLYLQGHPATTITKHRGSTFLLNVEEVEGAGDLDVLSGGSGTTTRLCESSDMTFVVKRGLQVLGCATYHHESGTITDVVLRPSAKSVKTGKALMDAIKNYAKRAGKEGTLMLKPSSEEDHVFFSQLGFQEMKDSGEMTTSML